MNEISKDKMGTPDLVNFREYARTTNRAFVLDPEKANDFLKQNNGQYEKLINKFESRKKSSKIENADTLETVSRESFPDNMKDSMIRASKKAEFTRNQLLDTLFEEGVLAVYNLGMKHMYEYLEDKW